MDTQALKGLPPLPKSLSGLLNFNSTQWRELERLHNMRTMIQQDLSRTYHQAAGASSTSSSRAHDRAASDGQSIRGVLQENVDSWAGRSTTTRLDAQLALLRKEMVGLRQLDMSLLCQLWSLNESIQEYKQAVQDRSPTAWDPTHEELLGQLNGRAAGAPSAAEPFDLEAAAAVLSRHHHAPMTAPHHQRSSSGGSGALPRHPQQHRHPPRNLTAVAEKGAPTDSSSCSSTEYDDVL
ncbi:unnamed protein product [Ixodes hexagonus]